jgi:hypothetical protein
VQNCPLLGNAQVHFGQIRMAQPTRDLCCCATLQRLTKLENFGQFLATKFCAAPALARKLCASQINCENDLRPSFPFHFDRRQNRLPFERGQLDHQIVGDLDAAELAR